MAKSIHTTVEKNPSGKRGSWIIRQGQNGRVTNVQTTVRSGKVISRSARDNSKLLQNLAKR